MTDNTNNETYNGWRNYETWLTNLWLDNEPSSHAYWREQAERNFAAAPECEQVVTGIWTVKQAARFHLADQLMEEITNASPFNEPTFSSDLYNAALQTVDWDEIAENLLVDFCETNDGGSNSQAHNRAHAIEQGRLMDVSEVGNECGIVFPVVFTKAVWERCIIAPGGERFRQRKEENRLRTERP